MVTFRIWLGCEGQIEIDLQCYSETWVMSIFMVGVCSQFEGSPEWVSCTCQRPYWGQRQRRGPGECEGNPRGEGHRMGGHALGVRIRLQMNAPLEPGIGRQAGVERNRVSEMDRREEGMAS